MDDGYWKMDNEFQRCLAPKYLLASAFVACAFFAMIVGPSTTKAVDTAPASPATQPVEIPVPVAAIPTYIAMGKDLAARLQIIRQTVDELSLDPATKKSADALVDAADTKIQTLLANARAGKIPSYQQVLAVPAEIKTARQNLLDLIGPDQTALLNEKMQSVRGEARLRIAQIKQMLDDLNLPAPAQTQCRAILQNIAKSVEELPASSQQPDDYTASRQKMESLFVGAHDELATILTPAEQSELGPRFDQLAAGRPTTQPAQKS
jgi:hypothetical protein